MDDFMIMSSLWVCFKFFVASILWHTLSHNVLEYTAENIAVQTGQKFISSLPQILIQQSSVLGSGLFNIANEGTIDLMTKCNWWENFTEIETDIHNFPIL